MLPSPSAAQTLFQKLWQRHLVDETADGEALLYVDRHLVYEVTSPQAFEGLRLAGRKPWRRETVLASADHNVPTVRAQRISIEHIADPLSAVTPVTPDRGEPLHFDIDATRKHRPLNGLDDIGQTLARADRIRTYEARRRELEPWLFAGAASSA